MEDLIGSLEVYHCVLLKYCRKILHFPYSSMAARTQLAVLHHNENVYREQATTSSGVPRYNLVFPKYSKEWVARKIYEPTTLGRNFWEKLWSGAVTPLLFSRTQPRKLLLQNYH